MKLEETNLKLPIPIHLCFDLSPTKVDVIKRLPYIYEASPVMLDVYQVQAKIEDEGRNLIKQHKDIETGLKGKRSAKLQDLYALTLQTVTLQSGASVTIQDMLAAEMAETHLLWLRKQLRQELTSRQQVETEPIEQTEL